MPYTADNIEINIANGTAVLATDYGTSGYGFTASHTQIAKLAWGNENVSYRANETYPLPVAVYGNTGSSLTVTGTVAGSGNFTVVPNTSIPLIVKGSSFNDATPIGISGAIQGMLNGRAVGISGNVYMTNTQVAIVGVSGGTEVGITGGRRLKSSTDSVTVTGSVGISGLTMSAAQHSVAVWGSDLGNKVLTRIYGSDGTTLGMSGDALKVALVNSGINFNVSFMSTVGVTNANETALRIQGYTGSGTPVTIKGQLAGGAVEIGAISPLPVGFTGTLEINDTDIVNSLESSSKPLISNLVSIAANTNIVSSISNQLSSASGANVTVREIKRPTTILNGQKLVTSAPSSIGTGVLKVGVTIKALRSNTGAVYVGNGPTLTSVTGYVLDAGDSVFIETDDLKRIFVRVDSGVSATVSYISS